MRVTDGEDRLFGGESFRDGSANSLAAARDDCALAL
jgi:hypothetical protein